MYIWIYLFKMSVSLFIIYIPITPFVDVYGLMCLWKKWPAQSPKEAFLQEEPNYIFILIYHVTIILIYIKGYTANVWYRYADHTFKRIEYKAFITMPQKQKNTESAKWKKNKDNK